MSALCSPGCLQIQPKKDEMVSKLSIFVVNKWISQKKFVAKYTRVIHVTVANFRIFKIHKFRHILHVKVIILHCVALPYVYIASIASFHELYTLSVHASTFVYSYTFGFTFGFKFST